MGLWSFVLCLVLLSIVTEASQEQHNSTVKLSERRRGKALKISKKPCTDPGGQAGVCTFKWDCINNNGTLMGTCVDGFIFGTCCRFDHDPTLFQDVAQDPLLHQDTNSITDDNNRIGGQLSVSSSTRVPTTAPTTTVMTTTTRRPVQIIRLTTPRPTVTTLRPTTASVASTSTGAQLVTWTSVGPTRPPQRPIILHPFPFRPGANYPALQNGWPVGVAFPVDPYQINRPLQVVRPVVRPQSPAASQASASNASYTILNGPDRTTLRPTSTGKVEMTTVSVPIPQWSSSTAVSVTTSARTTPRPPLPTGGHLSSSASQAVASSTGRPLKNTLDYRKDCGVRAIGPKARIVGGSSSYFGRWPWQVLVKEAAWLGLYQKNKCGGVLVSSKYAITAGHCQPGRFLSALVVILGEYDLLTDLERLKPEMRRVKRMIVHRHYNPQNFDNDIAILELDPPVVFKPHISPICLPDPTEDFTGRMAYVTGWGKTTHGGSIPNLLQEVQVPIMSNAECVSMFKEAGHSKLIKESFVCAGYKTGGKDSCEGDSGGPLMVERENGQWVLVGTVSHGIRCADPNLPGVYMKISAYRSWIDKIIK